MRHDTAVLQKRLGHRFENTELLERALTHTSWRNEHIACARDNQRLEFLGDAVIGLAASELLFRRFPDYSEGRLSRLRAQLVSEGVLARRARRIGLGEFLRLGRGESADRGAEKDSILCGGYEALLGAVYMDAGFLVARECAVHHLKPELDALSAHGVRLDSKSELQEIVQARYHRTPTYRLVDQRGPDHETLFVVAVEVAGKEVARGEGRSKKAAEQSAATAACTLLLAEGAEAS